MKRDMSAIGPKQTCASAVHMSAFGGKADMVQTSLVTKLGFTVQKNAFSTHKRR